MKDNFSHRSEKYAQFRPSYPDAFYQFILAHVSRKERAWDCGTGNGQVAGELANYFREVFATDISTNQLQHAVQKKNIRYMVEEAGQASFSDDFFDLIIVAQAIHWFDFEKFYRQVSRTAKANALFVAAGYGLMQIDEEADRIIDHLYKDITGKYWDDERLYVDEEYRTIPFPFPEIAAPQIFIETSWNLEQLTGYLNTWSGVQHYIEATGTNPLEHVKEDLAKCWQGKNEKKITFPMMIRAGRVNG